MSDEPYHYIAFEVGILIDGLAVEVAYEMGVAELSDFAHMFLDADAPEWIRKSGD